REAGRADEDVTPDPVAAAPQRNEVVAGRLRDRRLGRQGVRHAAVWPATSSASWPAEGYVKNTATGSCTPVVWWMSWSAWTAATESPPSAKKSSSGPSRSSPRAARSAERTWAATAPSALVVMTGPPAPILRRPPPPRARGH